MPKPCSLMKMSCTITEFINMNLEYLDHCLHVGNFLGFLTLDVLELNCLLSCFHSLVKPWGTSMKVRSLRNCIWQKLWEEESWAFFHWETSSFSLNLYRQKKKKKPMGYYFHSTIFKKTYLRKVLLFIVFYTCHTLTLIGNYE